MIRLLAAVGLLAVALLALFHVLYPFDDDQGLFTYGGKALTEGSRLYVDFWDLKQPGIFWFYALAGSLFGFDEVGIHSFDLIWMMLLAGAVLAVAKRCFHTPVLIGLAPLICLGPFYARADPIHLTQVEIIVVLPITLLVWLLLDAAPGRDRAALRFAIAGALIVVVAVFKLILTTIPAAILAVALLMAWRVERRPLRDVFTAGVLPAAAGALSVLALVVAWLWHDGTLEQTWWVAFTYPPRAVAEYAWQTRDTLRSAFGWFWGGVRFLMPFALVGAWRELMVRRSRLGFFVLAWIVVGGVAVVAQVLSWWEYHFNLFFVPVGLLAVSGAEVISHLLTNARYRRWMPLLCCAFMLALAVGGSMLHKLQRYWFSGPSPLRDPMAFMIRVELRMQTVKDAMEFLARPDARPGVVANLGDPRIFLYAHRPTLFAVNGSGYMLASQWKAAAELLARERPVYIYLGNDTYFIWNHGGDAILRWVAANYVYRQGDARIGEWYELREGAANPDASPAP